MAVAGGTIWLVYHGLVLLALSYTTMGVFTNLSPTELHPNIPLATPIPSDFFDETTQYMMGRRSGWCGELLTMAVAMLGAAWQFCDSPQASNALAKWWGRAFLAQLCAFWVAPLYEATIFKACWVWFFWAALGGAWLWSEFGLEKPKRRPRPGSWSRSKKRGDAPVEEPAATAPAAAKPANAKAPLPKSPEGARPPPPPPPPGGAGKVAPPKLGTRAEGIVVEATSGPRTNYAFVRPADASSDDLYLHAAQMREGEAWVAIGDRVAYTIAKNEGKPGMPIKAVKCADAVVLERAESGANAPPPPPPPAVASAFKALPPGANPAPPKPGTRGEGTVVEVRGRGEGNYGFVRPADASSDDLFLHAADMRAGEAWVAIGDRVAYVTAKNEERRIGGGRKAVRKAVKCVEVVVLERARGAADAAARVAACSYGESARALKRRDAAVGRAAKSPPRPPGLAAKPPPGFQFRVGWEDDDSDDSLERYA